MLTNSALEWLPLIGPLVGVNIPTTLFVRYDHMDIVGDLEGEPSKTGPKLFADMVKACEKICYPCFIRTDLASAKHSGPKAYLVKSQADLKRAIGLTVEDNEMKFWLEREKPQAFMVREFLELDAAFTAFDGLPISREWRFFASPNDIICWHPYWPQEAFEGYEKGLPADWRDALKSLADETRWPHELIDQAIQAAAVCGGECSVDFAMDINGKWWLLDMARKQDSYHWEGCEHGEAK